MTHVRALPAARFLVAAASRRHLVRVPERARRRRCAPRSADSQRRSRERRRGARARSGGRAELSRRPLHRRHRLLPRRVPARRSLERALEHRPMPRGDGRRSRARPPRSTTTSRSPDVLPQDRADAGREAQALRARPSVLTVTTTPPGASVTIDGKPAPGGDAALARHARRARTPSRCSERLPDRDAGRRGPLRPGRDRDPRPRARGQVRMGPMGLARSRRCWTSTGCWSTASPFTSRRSTTCSRGTGSRSPSSEYTKRYLSLDDAGVFRAVLSRGGRTLREDEVRALVAAKAPRFMERFEEAFRAFPGAAELIARRAARGPVGIVSGALEREIEFALTKMGARASVSFVVSAEKTPASKPDPSSFLLASRRASAARSRRGRGRRRGLDRRRHGGQARGAPLRRGEPFVLARRSPRAPARTPWSRTSPRLTDAVLEGGP